MNIMLEEVEVFEYLGSLVTAVGEEEADVQQKVLEGSKVLGCQIICKLSVCCTLQVF